MLLFKQNYNSAVKELRLRLVAFPGVVEIAHPQPLLIETAAGRLLNASDAYALNAPVPNVGEYNLTTKSSVLKIPSPKKDYEEVGLR